MNRITRKDVKAIYQDFSTKMNLGFSDKRNLEILDFIIKKNLSDGKLKDLQRYKSVEYLFYLMFGFAIQSDTSFKTSRLILDIFLLKITAQFGKTYTKILIMELSESLARFFKNLIFGKHPQYREMSILEVKERFSEVFKDILVIPKQDAIKEAVLEYLLKKYKSRFISINELKTKIGRKEIIIFDASYVLEALLRDKELFYEKLKESRKVNLFVTSFNIFDEIILHYEFIDRTFYQFMLNIWICDVDKVEIQELYKEVQRIYEIRNLYKRHEHYSFMNDLSLVVLGRHLQDYNVCIFSRDVGMLRMLYYYGFATRSAINKVINV